MLMKPVAHSEKPRATTAWRWLAASTLSFVSLVLVLPVLGQPQAKIDSLKNELRNAREDTTKASCLLDLSSECLDANDFAAAIDYADSALAISRRNNFTSWSADALGYVGLSHHYQGNYQEAMGNYLAALELWEEVGNKMKMGNTHNNLFALYSVLGDSIQAMKHITATLKIREETGDKPGMAAASVNMGMIQFNQGHYSEALEYFYKALALYEETDNKKGAALAYINIGDVHKILGNYSEALANFKISLKINEEIGDKRGIANSNQAIGSQYLVQAEYLPALTCQTAAMDIYKEIGDRVNVALTSIFIANIHNYQGNYPEALNYYYSALKTAEELGDKSLIANCFLNIGTIFRSQSNYEAAIKNYKSGLEICIELGDRNGMATAYSNIGIVYDLQGHDQEALNHYLEAVKIREEIGDKAGMADSYSNIGTIYEEKGEYSKALKYLFLSLSINEELGNRAGKATTLNNIALIYRKQANYDEARKYLNEGLALALKIGTKSEIEQSYKELSRLDSTESNFQKALEHYKLYIIYKDSLGNEESQRKIAELQLQYETEKKDQEIELLNKDNEIKALQLSRQKAIRHGMIAGIVLLFVTGFLLFRSFRLRKRLEQQQAIISERRRISADLHDDVGSGLSRIMLLTELVKNEAKTPEMKQEAEKIAAISKELSANISEIIWALNANNDTLESLVAYIRRYAAEFFEDAAVKLKISTPGGIAKIPLSGEKRRDIFYTVKEALHNIMKHSGATEAELSFTLNEGELAVEIRDNGRGIPEEAAKVHGNGLNNMRQRMEAVRGSFSIENHEGTKITMKVPVL